MSSGESTPRSDPQAYLASRKFSRRLRSCPRTGLPVSYADLGDSQGVPLLWVTPSGCSRWLVAPQDPLARKYGVRLIAVDRPGVGATPMVPLEDRIRVSCEMMQSVLEHLEIKIAHLLATSAGIYYALQLLIHHQEIFSTALWPPPSVYLIAPWSPLLPSRHPDYYSSPFAWIPDKMIETQHVTLPPLTRMATGAVSAWDASSKAVTDSFNFARSMLWSSGPTETSSLPDTGEHDKGSNHVEEEGLLVTDIEKADLADGAVSTNETGRLWGECPCCIGCVGRSQDYTRALPTKHSVGQGKLFLIGRASAADYAIEHLQCLNRGQNDTGHQWLENTVSQLAECLRQGRTTAGSLEAEGEGVDRSRLHIRIWWGWQDGMVPRKGQLWFNKVFTSQPEEIEVDNHDVPDGDHSNLLSRVEGIHQVYGLIWERGLNKARRKVDGRST